MLPPDANSTLPEGRCNWFNYAKMESMLRDCGFNMINRSSYLQSSEAKLREPTMFDSTTPEFSLYVNADLNSYLSSYKGYKINGWFLNLI